MLSKSNDMSKGCVARCDVRIESGSRAAGARMVIEGKEGRRESETTTSGFVDRRCRMEEGARRRNEADARGSGRTWRPVCRRGGVRKGGTVGQGGPTAGRKHRGPRNWRPNARLAPKTDRRKHSTGEAKGECRCGEGGEGRPFCFPVLFCCVVVGVCFLGGAFRWEILGRVVGALACWGGHRRCVACTTHRCLLLSQWTRSLPVCRQNKWKAILKVW